MTSTVQLAAAAFGAGFLAHKLVTTVFLPPPQQHNVQEKRAQLKSESVTRRISDAGLETPPDSPNRNRSRRVSIAPETPHDDSDTEREPTNRYGASRMSFMSIPGTPDSDSSSHSSAERLNGVESAAAAALKLSDAVFAYETGDADSLSIAVNRFLSDGESNIHGRSPTFREISTRSGAGRIVVGAGAAGVTNISVFVPSQSLPLMLPAIKELRRTGVPVVLHVLAQSMNDNLSYAADISGVLLARDAGAAIAASYSVQECFNMALVAHIVAKRMGTPVIHTFDGDQVARTATVVNKLDFTSDFLDSLSNDASTSVPEAFESTFAQLAPYIHKRYSIFEAPRPQVSSTRVLVVFGPGAGALARAATKRGVHVIVVRLYRPWSAKHFVHALPQAVRQLTRGQRWTIGVATLSGRASVLDALVGDVISTLTSTAHWNGPAPSVVKFSLAPNAHGVTSGMANEVTETLLSATGSAAVKIDPSNSHSHKLSSIEAGYSISLWATPDADAPATDVLAAIESSAFSAHALQQHSVVESDHVHPLDPTHGRLVLTPSDEENEHHIPDKYDAVVVADPALLTSHPVDIARELANGGHSTLVVAGGPAFSSQAELLDTFPDALKLAVATTESKIVTLVGEHSHVTSETVAQLALSSALSGGSVGEACPPSWRSIDASTDLAVVEGNFTRRLSSFATRPTNSTAPSATRRKSTVMAQHRVSWGYIFDSSTDKKEVLRPTEHGVYRVKCTKNVRLTPADYHRNVFHLEFDISGTGLTYNIGDALGVFGHNDQQEVAAFIQAYGLSAEDFVSIPHEAGESELLTVQQLLKTRLDLFGKPSQKFYAALSEHATDAYEEKKLAWLGSEDKEGFRLRQFETATFADVLMEFPSARPSITELLDIIPDIKPRHYSISSSMKMCPTSVHLLVVAVDWTTPGGRKRFGQCTRYLAGLTGDEHVTVDIKPSVCHLPQDPKTPVVCAGLGTGLAPFRAFVQERTYLKSQGVEVGPMSMYFGARYRAQEYLYEDDLEAAAKAGIITDLRLAFSRDTDKKVYIQDLIREDKAKLAQYFKTDGGFFYLCGPTWPVPEVRGAIRDGLQQAAHLSADASDDFLEEMKEDGRYILEVY